MSGIYIPTMEMPNSCAKCKLALYGKFDIDYLCPFLGTTKFDQDTHRHWACPLISVPDHGRLIDADAFLSLINDSTILSDTLKWIINSLIRGEPTIIEAEGEES